MTDHAPAPDARDAARWADDANRTPLRTLWSLTAGVRGVLVRMVRHRGNKSAYLRSLGVQVGTGCDIQTAVGNLGSEPWLLRFGNDVTVSNRVVFHTHDGSSRLFRQQIAGTTPWGNHFGPVDVKDNSFIGSDSVLMPGVTVGPNSIVGTGSVVTKDVPPGTVVAGVPARHICTLDEYVAKYRARQIPISATSRDELRTELTTRFWGAPR